MGVDRARDDDVVEGMGMSSKSVAGISSMSIDEEERVGVGAEVGGVVVEVGVVETATAFLRT